MAASLKTSELVAYQSLSSEDLILMSDVANSESKKVTFSDTQTSISLANFGTRSIDNLSDVVISGATEGQALIWQASGSQFVPGDAVTTLDTLTDVNISGVLAGDALIYNGTSWEDGTPSLELNDLTDVVIGTPSADDILLYNGTNFVPGTYDYLDLANAPLITTPDSLTITDNSADGLDFAIKEGGNTLASDTLADTDLLAALKRVDGPSTNLDADFVDGHQASGIAASLTITTDTDSADFTLTAADGSTVLGTQSIGGASESTAGLVTTLTQSFAGAKTFTGNVTISGNLTANGTTTASASDVVTIDDTLVELGTQSGSAPTAETTKDLGWIGHYHDGTSAYKASMFYDESADEFVLHDNVTESNGVLSYTGQGSSLRVGGLAGVQSIDATTTTTIENEVNLTSLTSVDLSGTTVSSADDNLSIDLDLDVNGVTDTLALDFGSQDLRTAIGGRLDNSDFAANAGIVDTKLDTIATEDKVSVSALNIDGATALTGSLEGADLLVTYAAYEGTQGSGTANTFTVNGTDANFSAVTGAGTYFDSKLAVYRTSLIDTAPSVSVSETLPTYPTLPATTTAPGSYDWTVGSGGNFANPWAAISSASVSDGDTIYILNGIYTIPSTLNSSGYLLVNKSLSFYGQSETGVIIQNSSSASSSSVLRYSYGKTILFHNLTIRDEISSASSHWIVQPTGTPGTTNLTFSQCSFGMHSIGVNVARVSNLLIEGCEFFVRQSGIGTHIPLLIDGISSGGLAVVRNNQYRPSTSGALATSFREWVRLETAGGAGTPEAWEGTFYMEGNSKVSGSGPLSYPMFRAFSHAPSSYGNGTDIIIKDNNFTSTDPFVELLVSGTGAGDNFRSLTLDNNTATVDYAVVEFNSTVSAVDPFRSSALPINLSGTTTFTGYENRKATVDDISTYFAGDVTVKDLAALSTSADSEPASYYYLTVDASDGTLKVLDKVFIEAEQST